MIECTRSLAAPDALADLVRRSYGLDVRSCVLVRALVNDVYELRTASQRYVLKVYRANGWSTDEVRWEQALAAQLGDRGVAVAAPVPLADGHWAGELAAPEGSRPFALAEYVEGEKPRPPFDDGLYLDFGVLIGSFHRAGDAFASEHERRPFDLGRTLETPLRLVVDRLEDRPDDRRTAAELGAEAGRRIRDLAGRGMDWGIRHGDVSLDNIHRTGRGLVLHDFDLAGEGWRAADLCGVRATPHWDAFLAGYARVRELGTTDLEALPWLDVAGLISNLAFHLADKPAWRGSESVAEGWVDRELDRLRVLAARL